MNNKFDDYIKQLENHDLHEYITKDKIINEHIILYGPSGIGKYSQTLKYIKDYSATNCKYDKKCHLCFKIKKRVYV